MMLQTPKKHNCVNQKKWPVINDQQSAVSNVRECPGIVRGGGALADDQPGWHYSCFFFQLSKTSIRLRLCAIGADD
jgi:hypothetical protein